MIATGIANCIFAGSLHAYAVMFLNWASCNMGLTYFCNNRPILHLLALFLSLPFAFINKLGFFAVTSTIATVVILVTSKCLTYFSKCDHGLPVEQCLQVRGQLDSKLVKYHSLRRVLWSCLLFDRRNRTNLAYKVCDAKSSEL